MLLTLQPQTPLLWPNPSPQPLGTPVLEILLETKACWMAQQRCLGWSHQLHRFPAGHGTAPPRPKAVYVALVSSLGLRHHSHHHLPPQLLDILKLFQIAAPVRGSLPRKARCPIRNPLPLTRPKLSFRRAGQRSSEMILQSSYLQAPSLDASVQLLTSPLVILTEEPQWTNRPPRGFPSLLVAPLCTPAWSLP